MRVILSLALVMLTLGGCVLFGGMQQSLTQMNDAQFTALEKQIYLISNRGFARLFTERPDLKEDMASFAEIVGPYLDEADSDAAFFITDVLDSVLLKISDPDVKFILELALLEIQKYGGLSYIDDAEVEAILNMRSMKLVQAILKGFVEALNG